METGAIGEFARATVSQDRHAGGASSFAELFRRLEKEYNLPPGLVEAVAQAESGLNPRVVSEAGAMGLMQLMPGTASALGVVDPFDPVQNATAGALYLSQLLEQFGGDLRLALAAYNAGPGAVEHYRGIPPYPETQAYVQRVLQHMQAPSGGSPTVPRTFDPKPSGEVLAYQHLTMVLAYARILWLQTAFSPLLELDQWE
ncbi:lytic transglycosylase domain-containing protein [Desulfothermobacter acidiphilus]|uniref:lytic transglycosylase domain-containing protein n=1 Tax=Desulfothermobacter acidiphilus TaxID=1938353 RepID=UPI003F8B36FB